MSTEHGPRVWIAQTKEYSDCRLVVSANAALMLGLEPPRPTDRDYWVKLVRLCGAEHGAAINPECFDRKAGVVARHYWDDWEIKDLVPPSVIAIHDPAAGFHAVLVSRVGRESVGVVGYKWSALQVGLSHRRLEELLPPRGNQNRRASRFFPLVMTKRPAL